MTTYSEALGLEEGMSLRMEKKQNKTRQEFKDCLIKELQAGWAGASYLGYLKPRPGSGSLKLAFFRPHLPPRDHHLDRFHLVSAAEQLEGQFLPPPFLWMQRWKHQWT